MPGLGPCLLIAPVIRTSTHSVAPRAAGVAPAPVTVGQQLGASVGTSLLNTIFAGVVTSYLTVHIAQGRVTGRLAQAGPALAHGYDTAFWCTAVIFACGAVAGGIMFHRGPLIQHAAPGPQATCARQAGAEPGPAIPA